MTLIELTVILGALAGAVVGAIFGWRIHPAVSLVGLFVGGGLGIYTCQGLLMVTMAVITLLAEGPRGVVELFKEFLPSRDRGRDKQPP
ncbi:hypothetical protein [Myxococcus qinghaiensis]|uniref:hypothetical protein n=1 Tax=Myxococcus qinghaiensis TaxID=2906758 RepID=UPI0020A7F468|nr:hypothetical protein [Myxococcus qinghaiensis]MCP3162710.1 hypothetical protein [Myxococcus qinghaiensis]